MFKLRHLTIAAFSAFAMLFLLPEEAKAQVPQGINYQAVARDTSGTPLAKETLDVVISIIDSNVFTTVYEETWDDVVTNRFGLFTIQIGRGVTVDDFTTVDWAGGGLYLNVNIDGVDMGNATELMTVPYAMYAENAGNVLVIDSASLDGTDYIIYTNNGNDTTNLGALAGSATGVDSGEIVGASMDTLRLYQNGGFIDIDVSALIGGGTSLDNDTTNELQILTISNDTIFLSDGGSVVLPGAVANNDNDSTNELQTVSISNDTIFLTDGGFAVLPAGFTNNDNDSTNELLTSVTITNDSLHITDAGGTFDIDLSAYVNAVNNDNDSTNELQTVSISNDTVYLTDGGFAVLPSASANNDNDSTNELLISANITNDSLHITDAGGTFDIDLSAYVNAAINAC
ncbi:MAG TPA: hypothetical protein DCX14_01460 [Flavobacteriales bacterium]|nr:hypothetical protein [Flavobacteriales bacterium]